MSYRPSTNLAHIASSNMKKVRVIFYRGPVNFFGKLVQFWTASPISHVEIWFEDGDCFTASETSGVIYFKRNFAAPRDWKSVLVCMPVESETACKKFLDQQVGLPYDWLGITMVQVLGLRWESARSWFCSELVWAALKKAAERGNVTPAPDNRMACGVCPAKLHALLTGTRYDRPAPKVVTAIVFLAAITILAACLYRA